MVIKKLDYIVIPQDIKVREYDIRTPKGNKARKSRKLEKGKKLKCLEEFLSTNQFRNGMYYKLLDETDGYIYYVYTQDVKSNKHIINKKTNIRQWYIRNYPNDDLGQSLKSNITFYDAFECLDMNKDFYEFLGVDDSIVRERVFQQLAVVMGCNYDYLYNQWLFKG